MTDMLDSDSAGEDNVILSVQQEAEDGVRNELPDVTIDRSSPVPFYFQLSELLEQEIASGRWPPDTRLPSEPDLCHRYGVSRTTVRQALGRLEQEGLISREKGRGTFVRASEPRSWLIQTTEGFFDEFLRTGHAVTSKVLRLERAPLPRWASDALDMHPGALGVTVERVRSVDGLVALYVVNYLPEELAPVVLELDPNESLYQRLAREGGVSIIGGSRSVEAVPAGPQLARLLEVAPDHSLVYIESIAWDQDHRPVDCYRGWLRTDRMRIQIHVSAQRHDGLQTPGLVTQARR
jgi:GntR family transcriptional regulator